MPCPQQLIKKNQKKKKSVDRKSEHYQQPWASWPPITGEYTFLSTVQGNGQSKPCNGP